MSATAVVTPRRERKPAEAIRRGRPAAIMRLILRRLGWHYIRVHAFDLYSDPADVASRIAAILGVEPETPTADTTTQPIDVIE